MEIFGTAIEFDWGFVANIAMGVTIGGIALGVLYFILFAFIEIMNAVDKKP